MADVIEVGAPVSRVYHVLLDHLRRERDVKVERFLEPSMIEVKVESWKRAQTFEEKDLAEAIAWIAVDYVRANAEAADEKMISKASIWSQYSGSMLCQDTTKSRG